MNVAHNWYYSKTTKLTSIMIKLTCMRLPVSHGSLHSDNLSNLLVLTFTEAKATAPCYYNDYLLLESLNSKLKSFYCKTAWLYLMSQQKFGIPK